MGVKKKDLKNRKSLFASKFWSLRENSILQLACSVPHSALGGEWTLEFFCSRRMAVQSSMLNKNDWALSASTNTESLWDSQFTLLFLSTSNLSLPRVIPLRKGREDSRCSGVSS